MDLGIAIRGVHGPAIPGPTRPVKLHYSPKLTQTQHCPQIQASAWPDNALGLPRPNPKVTPVIKA